MVQPLHPCFRGQATAAWLGCHMSGCAINQRSGGHYPEVHGKLLLAQDIYMLATTIQRLCLCLPSLVMHR